MGQLVNKSPNNYLYFHLFMSLREWGKVNPLYFKILTLLHPKTLFILYLRFIIVENCLLFLQNNLQLGCQYCNFSFGENALIMSIEKTIVEIIAIPKGKPLQLQIPKLIQIRNSKWSDFERLRNLMSLCEDPVKHTFLLNRFFRGKCWRVEGLERGICLRA